MSNSNNEPTPTQKQIIAHIARRAETEFFETYSYNFEAVAIQKLLEKCIERKIILDLWEIATMNKVDLKAELDRLYQSRLY